MTELSEYVYVNPAVMRILSDYMGIKWVEEKVLVLESCCSF